MGSLATARTTITASVASGGTLTLPYPAGATQALLTNAADNQIVVGEQLYAETKGQILVAFGATTITITNQSGETWRAPSEITVSYGRSDLSGTYTHLPATRLRGDAQIPVAGEQGRRFVQPVITVAGTPLTITGAPPAGVAGQAYTFTPTVAGGSGTRRFTLRGSLLAGLSFNSDTGAITGMPSGRGTMDDLAIIVTDTQGQATLQVPAITIASAAGAPVLPAHIYNLKASNTARLKAGLQAMQAGTRNALIHGHGHSCMAGQVSNGGNQIATSGPMTRLAAKLKLAGFAAGANNLFGYHAGYALAAGGTGLQAMVNADNRVTIAGTMAIQGVEGPGGLVFGATDATGTMDIAFPDQTTEYDVYSTQNGGHATYYHSVDGGAQIKVNTGSPTTAALRKESVNGLSKALHTIRHGRPDTLPDGSTANSGATRVIGIEARDGTRKEISCRNFGISGIQASSMLTDTQPYTRRSADKTLGGDCWFIMCIINDARQQPAQPTIATTKANIKAKVQDAKLAGADPVLVMEHFVGDTTSGNLAQWLDYRTALYQIADEEDCPLIDFGVKWGSYATANAAGKMSDVLHPSFAGYDDMANTYGAVVRWALTGTYNEVF